MGMHRYNGWPGAFCLLCGSEDAMEIAIADGWYDPWDKTWDTEEHRLQVEKNQNSCPCTKDGEDPYKKEIPHAVEK